MASESRAELLALFEDLEAAVDAFNAAWPTHLQHAELYCLPILTDQSVPGIIEPEHLTGESAERMARYAFRAFEREPDQHPATVARYPGVLIVRHPMLREINTINDLKDRIRSLVSKHPPGSRANLARNTLPGRVMLQIYRHVHSARNVRRVLWTWAANTTGSRVVTASEAAKEIEAGRPYPPDHMDREGWNAVIDAELRTLASFAPSTKLVYRRSVAPHPRVTLYEWGERKAAAIYHGNLPLVVCVGDEEQLPSITPLPGYDRDVRPAQRSDRRRLIPVIDRLHLYVRADQMQSRS